MEFLEHIYSTIKKFNMISGGETVLIGLSGGPDSVCLANALHELSPRLKIILYAVYIDHGLRPGETDKEILFCKSFCDSINISFESKKIDVKTFARENKLNVHEAGRALRYGTLETVARDIKATRIALGHNLDDKVETFIFHLMRGAGTKGLSSIPPARGSIIRPLIETGRSEIEKYLGAEGINFVVDSSNLKTDYTRNKVRAKLIPVMKEIFPSFLQTVSKTAEILSQEDRYLEVTVTKTLMRLINKKTDKEIILLLGSLEHMDIAILRRVLRRVINESRGLRGISFIHIEDIVNLIRNGKHGDRIDLPGAIKVIKDYSTLNITAEKPVKIGIYELEPDDVVELRELNFAIEARLLDERPEDTDPKTTAVFDAGKIVFPLVIRPRRDGDYFYPSGLRHKKKLQDFFVDEKIPRDDRDLIPLITSNGEIVWVVGKRRDARFEATDETKRFLVVRVNSIEE